MYGRLDIGFKIAYLLRVSHTVKCFCHLRKYITMALWYKNCIWPPITISDAYVQFIRRSLVASNAIRAVDNETFNCISREQNPTYKRVLILRLWSSIIPKTRFSVFFTFFYLC